MCRHGHLEELLFGALNASWSKETSYEPALWSPSNPALGQCAVTALIVQDACGGELVEANVDGRPHFWNLLPDGQDVDLTREQFDSFHPSNIRTRHRNDVLSLDETLRRYATLRDAVEGYIDSARHAS